MNFAFKTLAACLLTFSIAQVAKASEQPVGSFVAQECGDQQIPNSTTELAIQKVCIGALVAPPEQETQQMAFAFEFADGSQHVFELAQTSDFRIALPNHHIKSLFQLVDAQGLTHAMKVTRTTAGQIESISGDVEGSEYYVPAFQAVFVVQ